MELSKREAIAKASNDMNVFKNAPDWAEWFAINSDGMGFYPPLP